MRAASLSRKFVVMVSPLWMAEIKKGRKARMQKTLGTPKLPSPARAQWGREF